jgi:spore germination cell wall hydrolase CwlJ-like protein
MRGLAFEHRSEAAAFWVVSILTCATPFAFYLYLDGRGPTDIQESPQTAFAQRAPAAHSVDWRTQARMSAQARFDAMRQTWRPTNETGCLAEAMYYEAVGEGEAGQEAVAEVILERTRDGNYPHTICGVVYDGVRPGRIDCQFTYACDGSIARPKRLAAWTRVKLLAEGIVSGTVKLVNSTGHAVAYHNTSVTPAWSGTMEKTTQIGNHIFYRWSSRSLPVRATQDEVAARR